MRYSDIVLSDGQTINVRRLGLFELADLDKELPPPFRFSTLTITGDVIEQDFDFAYFTEPPTPPDDSHPPENSPDWYTLKEYNLYHAAIAHEAKRIEAYQALTRRIAQYILSSCIDPADLGHITEPSDYTTVYHAAIVPQLTMEALGDELARFFQSNLQRLAPVRLPVYGGVSEISEPGESGGSQTVGV